MSFSGTEPAQNRQHGAHIPGSVRIPGVAGDPDETILGEWAGGPGLTSRFSKPAMSCFVMDVHRIAQSKQHIDIQQIGGHVVSSRSWLTSSSVTTPASCRTGNSGTP